MYVGRDPLHRMHMLTQRTLRNSDPTSPKPHSNGLGPHGRVRLSYTSPQAHQAKESGLVNKPTKSVPLFLMWDKLKHLKHLFTFTLFLQSQHKIHSSPSKIASHTLTINNPSMLSCHHIDK